MTVAAAGLLTAALAWVKVTTGAFVLAGGLYYLFYLRPLPSDLFAAETDRKSARMERVVEFAGLVLCGVVFHIFIGAHFGWRYFLYLSVPLIVVLAWTGRALVVTPPVRGAFRARCRETALYFGTSAIGYGAFLFGYFRGDAFSYLAEQAKVFSLLDYASPFPPFGTRGAFGAFNASLWPELPWLATALFVTWLVLRARPLRGRAGAAPSTEKASPTPDAVVIGLFSSFTFHTFVLYPRADESYVLVACLPAVVVVFVLIRRLEEALRPALPWATQLARGMSAILLLSLVPLISVPTADDYQFGRSDWGSPRLRHLRYHPADYPLKLVGRPLAQWDREIDDAARKIDALTEDGEPVLVVGRSQLLNFASHTEPVGGRYSHFFYLLRNGVLGRKAFLELVPREVLDALYANPPRVMVEVYDDRILLDRLPELQAALSRSAYRLVGRWSVFRVYERQPQQETGARPARY